jgi:multidrug resistance efflux pump
MLLTPPPIWSRTLIWSLSIGSLVLLTWSVFTKIEETSSLPGQLETLRSEVSVRSPDTAVVSAVKVRQYQQVKLNQVLYVLSRQDLEPRLNGLKRKLVMLYDRNYHEQKSLQSRLRQAKAQINLNANIVRRLRSLYQQGSVQEVQLLEKQNQLYQSRQEYQTLSEERAKAAINYRIEANDVRNQLQELQGRSRQFEIHTPIAGTLQKMAVQAKGERVQAGDVLATVVPREGLIAAVQVSSRLAGPIAPGKPVDITVDAFPANDFGTLKGEVETISPTTAAADARAQAQTQPPAYLARIRISPSGIPAEFPAASLRSGMGITARVVLKEKPVISLVFDFVRDLFQPMADRR